MTDFEKALAADPNVSPALKAIMGATLPGGSRVHLRMAGDRFHCKCGAEVFEAVGELQFRCEACGTPYVGKTVRSVTLSTPLGKVKIEDGKTEDVVASN